MKITMNVYTMTTEDMTRNANQIKEIVICSLEREGLLNRPSKEKCIKIKAFASNISILEQTLLFQKLVNKMP